MFKNKIIIVLFFLVTLFGCTKEPEKIKLIKETNQKVEMISAYKAFSYTHLRANET